MLEREKLIKPRKSKAVRELRKEREKLREMTKKLQFVWAEQRKIQVVPAEGESLSVHILRKEREKLREMTKKLVFIRAQQQAPASQTVKEHEKIN